MKKMGIESNVIRQELLEIEEERNIQILYAAEYGRRARGYPSLDSRYDVRFIYRKNASERYLNEEYGQNLINWPSKYQNLDFTGLDIRHFLKLFANCHPAVYELFLSSINYRQKGSLRARIRSLMPEYFQPVKGSQYYFRYAEKKHIGFSNSKIQIGALFDMIRGLLACAWIREMNRIPPISPFEMLDLKILKEKKYAGFDAWFREEAERKKRGWNLIFLVRKSCSHGWKCCLLSVPSGLETQHHTFLVLFGRNRKNLSICWRNCLKSEGGTVILSSAALPEVPQIFGSAELLAS